MGKTASAVAKSADEPTNGEASEHHIFYEFNFFLPTHTHSSLQSQSLPPPFYGPSAAADDDDDDDVTTALLHRDHITNS